MEIPVIHEITRVTSSAPHTAPVLVSSSSISTTNHFFHHGRAPIQSQSSLPGGTTGTGMSREQGALTSNKPKTPAKPTIRKPDDATPGKSPQRTLHTRLPSTDSGIQADGGFDSLSRYRGKTFLSASNTSDSISTDAGGSSKSGSGTSSGYSSDHQGSLVTHVVSLPSKSFFSPPARASPPVPAVRNSLTSQNSLTSSQNSTSGNSQNGDVELTNGLSVSSHSPRNSSELLPKLSSDPTSSLHPNTHSSNEKSGFSDPLTSIKTDHVISTANQNQELVESSAVNQKLSSDSSSYIKMSPSVQVFSNNKGVKLDFTNNSVNISTMEGASKSEAGALLKTRSSNTSATTAPSSTFKVHVINAPQPQPGQQDNPKPRGQGCIALTRPLRLGAPSQPAARPAPPHPTQPQQPTPAARTTDAASQPSRSLSSSGRAKPKIAPRPTIAPKPSPHSSPSKAVAADKAAGSTTTSTVTFTKNSSADLNASTHKETIQITQIPVTYRPSPPNSQQGRREIPVKHMENVSTASHKSQLNPARPKSLGGSFSRLTPERDRQRQPSYERRTPEKDRLFQNNLNNRQPIYENVFNVKDGFSFDDHSTRMKQAELILKQSDELISDALKMLSASPSPMGSPRIKKNGISPEVQDYRERVVEGSDAKTLTPEREHRVPVFDVQTGKFYGGPRPPSFNDVRTPTSSLHEGGKVKDVSWNERKVRIDSALSWLQTELAGLRAMDNTLISQFKRCQETIDALKTQRDVWEGLSEEGEDGEYWDDYEISEFNRRYLDSPGGSSSSQFSPGSRDPSLQDVSSISFQVPQLQLPQVKSCPGGSPNQMTSPTLDRTPIDRRGSVTQDIEATL